MLSPQTSAVNCIEQISPTWFLSDLWAVYQPQPGQHSRWCSGYMAATPTCMWGAADELGQGYLLQIKNHPVPRGAPIHRRAESFSRPRELSMCAGGTKKAFCWKHKRDVFIDKASATSTCMGVDLYGFSWSSVAGHREKQLHLKGSAGVWQFFTCRQPVVVTLTPTSRDSEITKILAITCHLYKRYK